jgi:transcriptional regulator with XRE-family HTH domain
VFGYIYLPDKYIILEYPKYCQEKIWGIRIFMMVDFDFSGRIKAILKELKLNQVALAAKMNLSQGVISEFASGARLPSKEFIFGLPKLGISLDWFLTGIGEMFLPSAPASAGRILTKPAEGHKVPLLRQKVSCGPGVDWETDDNVEEYIDVFSILPRLSTGRMYAFKASGSSMLGAGIRNGDYLIFNAELGFIPKDDIYVFTLDGEVYCKRLEFDMLANKIKIYSVRVADLEKAELVRTLDMTESSYGDRFRIFGRVRCLLRPNRGND